MPPPTPAATLRAAHTQPAILHSSKTPLKKWQYNISRARSSAITGSPAPNSLPWTGLLQKSDFFGQRWTFEVPSRPSSNGRAHPRGLATLANRDMGVCPGGGAGFGAGFGVGETGADYGRMTLDAIGTTGGDLTYEWTGATEMKLTAKGTGSDRPIAMFMRDIKVEKGAGELIFDADVSVPYRAVPVSIHLDGGSLCAHCSRARANVAKARRMAGWLSDDGY